MNWFNRFRTVAVLTVAVIAAPGVGSQASRTPLSSVQAGRWQLQDLDNRDATPRRICIANPQELLQVEHAGAACSRMVVSADAKRMTVHYTCAGEGFGQTNVRFVSANVVRIDTQGIAGGRPFNYRFDARRVGGCSDR